MPDPLLETHQASTWTLGASTATLTGLRWLAAFAAVLAVSFSVLGRRLELVQFKPGGAGFDSLVRPIFLGIFVVGLLIAVLRWEIIGGMIAIFAAAGVVAFATNQLIAPHAALTVGAYAFPAALWVLIDLIELPPRRAAFGLAAAAVLAVVGYLLGSSAYDRVWGPTHPEATVQAPDSELTEWIWTGRTTTVGAQVRAKFFDDFTEARLRVWPDGASDESVWVEGMVVAGFRVVSFDIDGLVPDTLYRYSPEVDGRLDEPLTGSFRTFPDGPSSFLVAFGACARVGSNGAVFSAIEELDPVLYGIIGDFHYGDNDVDSLARYHDVLDITLSRPAQSSLYRSTSIAYVWDDHDYGANDSDGDSFARAAAMSSYRQYVPSYDLGGPFSAVYQAFTIGRVRFVFTDARAARDSSSKVDDADKSMLGADQKAWLKRELVNAAATHELVVWVNPVPWVAEASEGADHWGGYSTERRELADYIAEHDITNLLMVSGDAHMVAIDDGTNSNFATEADGPAFPVVHAAALDRPGGVKGGPYSEGAIGGSGQFATVEVIDDGGLMEVVLAARSWDGQTMLDYRFTVDPRT